MMTEVYIFDPVKQGSTNYGLEIVFVNKVLLVHYYANSFKIVCGCSPMMGWLQQTLYGLQRPKYLLSSFL